MTAQFIAVVSLTNSGTVPKFLSNPIFWVQSALDFTTDRPIHRDRFPNLPGTVPEFFNRDRFPNLPGTVPEFFKGDSPRVFQFVVRT